MKKSCSGSGGRSRRLDSSLSVKEFKNKCSHDDGDVLAGGRAEDHVRALVRVSGGQLLVAEDLNSKPGSVDVGVPGQLEGEQSIGMNQLGRLSSGTCNDN